MPAYVLFSFLVYAVINAFTPGPGNILALSTVTNYGYHRGRPLFIGVFAGYYVVQIICVLFVYGLSTLLPSSLAVIKYIGAAYILWLAFHVAISRPDQTPAEASASFTKGFALQFVNVKIYAFGITALTGYVTGITTSLNTLLAFGLVIATIGTLATSTWIGAGVLIRRIYQNHYRAINLVMAAGLLECAYSMLR